MKTMEPVDFDQLLESATEEQLDRLLSKLEERREIKQQEKDERRRAILARAKAIADANKPKTFLQIKTEFNSRHVDVASVIDRDRGVQIFENGSYVQLAGEVAQRGGQLDLIEEPRDPLMRTRVRFDFYQTRAKYGEAAVRKQAVLEDNRRVSETTATLYSRSANHIPAANKIELDRVEKLIQADLQRAASLSKLCDTIDSLQKLHKDDEAKCNQLIQEAIGFEEAQSKLQVVDPRTLKPSPAQSLIETTMEV
jgi:hypothetical protein